jgi:hypothetical protein
MVTGSYRSRDGVWLVEPITLTLTRDERADGEYLRVTWHGFHRAYVRVVRDAQNDARLSAETMQALARVVPLHLLSVALTAVHNHPEGNHQ